MIRRFLALGCLLLSCVGYADEQVLNVYIWAGYLPDQVIRQFENEMGVRVNYSTYLNNEELYAKLKTNPNIPYDIIAPSNYILGRMIKHNLIQPIDKSKMSNFKNINSHFLGKEFDKDNTYSIPCLWTGTGIAINTKYHEKSKNLSWNDLWNSHYRNQLLLLDDARELFSMALLSMNESINTEDPAIIEKAFQKLKRIVKNVKVYNIDGQINMYLDEEVTLGMGWNGDIYLANLENPDVEFIYPTEGFIFSLDSLAIPKGAKHVELAHQFINFLLRGEVAKEISLKTGFSTINHAAYALLPETIKNNPILYPDEHLLKKGQMIGDVGKTVLLYESYFQQLKLEAE